MQTKSIQSSLNQLVDTYAQNNPNSKAMFHRAQTTLPGGNTRTGVYFAPFPLYAQRGEGVYLYDLDGHQLLDFVNNNTALILGHAHPALVGALQQRVALGTGFSRPLALEVEMAERLKERMPALEQIRFCSSGTEAVLNSLRTARAFTGRTKIAKIEGAYHGIDDSAMISYVPPVGPELGPENRPNSVSSSAGLAAGTQSHTLVLPFNDADACEAILRQEDDLAAVIVDPLSTASGLCLPEGDFLQRLRQLTTEMGALLIFDEIVSFRAGPGGTHQAWNITPDLVCLGKVIAGGTPGAAFGGRADVLALYNPVGGSIPQSGTYNGNPLSMVAGMTTLATLTPAAYDKLHHLTRHLATGLENTFKAAEIEAQITTTGSLLRVYFLPTTPRNYRQAASDNALLQRWLFFWLLERGIYWKVSGNQAPSLPMEEKHIDRLVEEVGNGLQQLKQSA